MNEKEVNSFLKKKRIIDGWIFKMPSHVIPTLWRGNIFAILVKIKRVKNFQILGEIRYAIMQNVYW